MNEYTLEMARKDIDTLNQERIAQLNRILASEALLMALLAEQDTPTLQVLVDRYDVRVLAAMQQLEPRLQRAHLWEPYTQKIQALLAQRHSHPDPETPRAS